MRGHFRKGQNVLKAEEPEHHRRVSGVAVPVKEHHTPRSTKGNSEDCPLKWDKGLLVCHSFKLKSSHTETGTPAGG